VQDWTGIEADEPLVLLIIIFPTLDRAVLHLDHDRLFRQHPEGARRGGADRRRGLFSGATRIFRQSRCPGVMAATIFAFTVSWADFLYPMAFATSVGPDGLPAGIVPPHQGRRVQLGPDLPRSPARGKARSSILVAHGSERRRSPPCATKG